MAYLCVFYKFHSIGESIFFFLTSSTIPRYSRVSTGGGAALETRSNLGYRRNTQCLDLSLSFFSLYLAFGPSCPSSYLPLSLSFLCHHVLWINNHNHAKHSLNISTSMAKKTLASLEAN